MACDPATLVDDSKCLVAGMGERQLLAYIAYQLAVNAGVDPTPETLVPLSKCLWASMGESQLLASIVYLQCQLNGG